MSGFVCARCGNGDMRVINSRRPADNEHRRRRECSACQWRTSTIEVSESRYNRLRTSETPAADLTTPQLIEGVKTLSAQITSFTEEIMRRIDARRVRGREGVAARRAAE